MSERYAGEPRRWAVLLLVAVGLALLGGAAKPSGASAAWSDIYHWDLHTTVTTYPAGSPAYRYYVDEPRARYRWTVDTPHSTRVSINFFLDYSQYEAVDIPAHSYASYNFGDQDYDWYMFQDMVLRGRSLYGSQYNRNGQLWH